MGRSVGGAGECRVPVLQHIGQVVDAWNSEAHHPRNRFHRDLDDTVEALRIYARGSSSLGSPQFTSPPPLRKEECLVGVCFFQGL